MKVLRLFVVAVCGLAVIASIGLFRAGNVNAQSSDPTQAGISTLKEKIDALKRQMPDQAHAMSDVDYHFSNLWFAVQNANWPLAEFYLGETRSHLKWAVRLRPVRRLSSGQELDLRSVLQGIESSTLAEIKASIEKRDIKGFESAYRSTMAQCYGCHMAAEKPYLRPHIPEFPATRMIDLRPN